MFKRSFLQSVAALAVLAATSSVASAQDQVFKIGVSAGPHAQIMEQVKKVAATKGLNIQIVEFSDFVQPNAALAAGDLSANSYQHKPYLDAQMKARGYKFAAVAPNVNLPMAVYSKKVKNLSDLPNGARVGIPNDPTNGGRALLLLEAQGLIKIKPGIGLQATPLDVTSNPKKIKFIELDAAQLSRSLDDVDAAAINTNYAISAGLNPKADSLALESSDGPYAGQIVVREADKDLPWVKTFVQSYHSDAVRDFVNTEFKGSLQPTW